MHFLAAYIAAIQFKDKANELREKCKAFLEPSNEAAPPEAKVTEDDIATAYASFLKGAIKLKQHLASLNGRVAETAELENQCKNKSMQNFLTC